MKTLKNWDNNNWLSSKEYLLNFHNYLRKEINFEKKTKILDIGCGRANIISFLQKKYKFDQKPIGLDIVKSKDIKKNILFIKKNAIKFLSKSKLKFNLILIKQTIHFFNKKEIKRLLHLMKKSLYQKGKIIVLTLNINNNQIPCFKKMKTELLKSLNKDKSIVKLIKKDFKKYKMNKFKFNVSISKRIYLRMIKERFISCLLNLTDKEVKKGLLEIQSNYKNKIKFDDTLEGIIFKN